MSIHEELVAAQREAMKSGDKAVVNVIRQVESEVSVAKTAPGFDAATDDDEVYLSVMAGYVKKMNKARREYESLGEAGQAQADKLAFEVDYLSRWLPDTDADEAAIQQAVREAIAELGADDPKLAGQVTGHVMRNHDGFDGAVVNRVAREELGS